MLWVLFFTAAFFLFYVQAGLYILRKHPDGRLNRSFCIWSVWLAVISLGVPLVMASIEGSKSLLLFPVIKIAWSLLPFFMLRFFMSLPTVLQSSFVLNRLVVGSLFVGVFSFLVFLAEGVLLWYTKGGIQGNFLYAFYILSLPFYGIQLLAIAAIFFVLIKSRRYMRLRREKLPFSLLINALLFALLLLFSFSLIFSGKDWLVFLMLPSVVLLPLFVSVLYGFGRFYLLFYQPDMAAIRAIHFSDAVAIFCDLNHKLIYANKYTEQLLKESSMSHMPLQVGSLFLEKQKMKMMIRKAIIEGYAAPADLKLLDRHGREVAVRVACESLIDSLGDSHGVAIYGEDRRETLAMAEEIRQRAMVENELKKTHEGLEEEIDRRYRETVISSSEASIKMDERLRIEEALRAELEEMNVMLGEINHRVRKNMRLFLSVLAASAPDSEFREAGRFIASLRRRVSTILMVYENKKTGRDVGRVDFKRFIVSLTAFSASYYNYDTAKVRMDIDDLSDIPLCLEQAVPLGLALNEVLNNACQYAFSGKEIRSEEQGVIRIGYRMIGPEFCQLEINDNGVGFHVSVKEEAPDTSGLQLARMLVEEQINGSFELLSGDGVLVKIVFQPAPSMEIRTNE